jgi:hypothetical protein
VAADRVGVDAQLVAGELAQMVGNLVLGPVAGAALALKRRPVHHGCLYLFDGPARWSHVPGG